MPSSAGWTREKPFGDIGNAAFENHTGDLWVSGYTMHGIQRPDRSAKENDAAIGDAQAADNRRYILQHADQCRLAC